MNDPTNTLLVFGFLTFFHLWGGAAIGAGVRGRRLLPLVWGLLVGGAPLYFGIERVLKLGAPAGLAWQIACLAAAAAAVGLGAPRFRRLFLHPGMASLMTGTFIMAASALAGALLQRGGSEPLSLLVGGAGFLFGAMWFGAGLRQLRDAANERMSEY